MTQHHIRLTNTAGLTYDLYPTTSPLAITLAAQASGTHFDYGTTFTNVTDVLLEVDNNRKPELTLNWPGGTDPQWSLTLVSGTTSYTSTNVGHSTKFTLDIPATGNSTSFTLSSGASYPQTLGVTIRPI
jgi:hypothetical protein